MKIFDANLILGKPGVRSSGVSDVAKLLAEMDRYDVEHGWVSHIGGAVNSPSVGNELLLRKLGEAGADGSRLTPTPVVRGDEAVAERTWDNWRETGVRGVRICPAFYGMPPRDAVLANLIAPLKRLGWFLQVPLLPFYRSPWRSAGVADAVQLASLDEGMRVVLTGASRSEFAPLRDALADLPNLFLDVGNLSTGAAVPELVRLGFQERLVCGSGYGVSCMTCFRDMVVCSGIPEAAQQAILHDNAKRLLTDPKG